MLQSHVAGRAPGGCRGSGQVCSLGLWLPLPQDPCLPCFGSTASGLGFSRHHCTLQPTFRRHSLPVRWATWPCSATLCPLQTLSLEQHGGGWPQPSGLHWEGQFPLPYPQAASGEAGLGGGAPGPVSGQG